MGNLDLWNKHADIDPAFTKKITGKDYGGTSPNPQYVVRCLTEMFGPVGKGFGWVVLAENFEPLGDTHLHWCRIRFWWRDEQGEHSVEEYGQTKAAYLTSQGKHRVDEDAPKKSLTDAIIKGASHLGVAANIFLGRWDDQKYVDQVNEEYRNAEATIPREPTLRETQIRTSIHTAATPDELRFVWSRETQQELWDLGESIHAEFKELVAARAKEISNTEQKAAA